LKDRNISEDLGLGESNIKLVAKGIEWDWHGLDS